MAMTAKSMPYKHGFGPFASEVYRAPLSYPFRDGGLDGRRGGGPRHRPHRQAGRRRQPGRRRHRADPGRGRLHRPGARASSRRWPSGAASNGVVFVADEVQTGFARTGAMFACEHEGVVPDLIVTAKGIAGGLPLSAVTGRAEMMDSVHAGGLGGTYGGNPLACAAALAVMDTIVEEGLVERAGQVERILTERLERIRAARPAGR